jgi:hypothetical protein
LLSQALIKITTEHESSTALFRDLFEPAGNVRLEADQARYIIGPSDLDPAITTFGYSADHSVIVAFDLVASLPRTRIYIRVQSLRHHLPPCAASSRRMAAAKARRSRRGVRKNRSSVFICSPSSNEHAPLARLGRPRRTSGIWSVAVSGRLRCASRRVVVFLLSSFSLSSWYDSPKAALRKTFHALACLVLPRLAVTTRGRHCFFYRGPFSRIQV